MKNNKSFFRSVRGFTLVEVMIVIGIIALLAAIAIPNLLRAKIIANDANAKATLKTISNALENYASINSMYPNDPSLIMGASPPYLTKNYFSGTYQGFSYTSTLENYSYSITAVPVSASTGSGSFTITTGSVLTENN